MRKVLLLSVLIGTALFVLWGRARLQTGGGNPALAATPFSATTSSKPDFDAQIKPIFQAKCQPCHFQGGKVYDKMPFDKAETITRLGTKLFTRIKDEKDQKLIREFLGQP